MSIREDAKNDRLVRETLGYSPELVIRSLRDEVAKERLLRHTAERELAKAEAKIEYLHATLQCFNGSNK